MTQPDTSTLAGRIAVEQAVLDGKPTQLRKRGSCDNNHWRDVVPVGWLFNWESYDYRIKPQPLRCWVNVYPDQLWDLFPKRALALAAARRTGERSGVPMVELTDEIETCLKANGLI